MCLSLNFAPFNPFSSQKDLEFINSKNKITMWAKSTLLPIALAFSLSIFWACDQDNAKPNYGDGCGWVCGWSMFEPPDLSQIKLPPPDTSCKSDPFLFGWVLDQFTGEPVGEAELQLSRIGGDLPAIALTDSTGFFYFCGDPDSSYYHLGIRWLPPEYYLNDNAGGPCMKTWECNNVYWVAFPPDTPYPQHGGWANGIDKIYVKPTFPITFVIEPSNDNKEMVRLVLKGKYPQPFSKTVEFRVLVQKNFKQKNYTFTKRIPGLNNYSL